MTPSRIHLDHLPLFPATIETQLDISDAESDIDQSETVTIPHPHAGEIDYDQLQEAIGQDAVYVGPGSEWQLPWEAGTGPVALTGDLTVQTSDTDTVTAAEDMNRGLNLAIRYALPIYPPRGAIRKHLAGKHLADLTPLGQPSHADVLLAIANGREYLG